MDRAAFWCDQHKAASIYWLTGTWIADLLRVYEIEAPEGRDITEIGVGLGRVTRALARCNQVTAVDIAPEAFAPLEGGGIRCLLTQDLALAPPADLAICHLVFQHCPSEEVARILRETPLKKGGIFLFQTAYLLEPDDGLWDPMRVVWHPKEEIEGFARVAGLRSFWTNDREFTWEEHAVGWSLFKARKE